MRSKNILVSGASFGIGRAIAVRFAQAGYIVGLIARGQKGLSETAEEINKVGGKSVVMRTDLSDFLSLEELVSGFVAKHGKIDCLWSGAFGYMDGPLRNLDISEANALFSSGVLGAMNLTKCVLHNSVENPLIYQVSADWAFPENQGLTAFIAAKKAVEGFAIALQKELHGKARITIVSPADVSSHSHSYDADIKTVLDDTNGAAIVTSELADVCFRLSEYKSLFVHRLNVLPLAQNYSVTYN